MYDFTFTVKKIFILVISVLCLCIIPHAVISKNNFVKQPMPEKKSCII